jgi:hypothetical protein
MRRILRYLRHHALGIDINKFQVFRVDCDGVNAVEHEGTNARCLNFEHVIIFGLIWSLRHRHRRGQSLLHVLIKNLKIWFTGEINIDKGKAKTIPATVRKKKQKAQPATSVR